MMRIILFLCMMGLGSSLLFAQNKVDLELIQKICHVHRSGPADVLLKNARKGITGCKISKDYSKLATFYTYQGIGYYLLDMPAEAIETYYRGLQIADSLKNEADKSWILLQIAQIYINQHQLDAADSLNDLILKKSVSLNNKRLHGLALSNQATVFQHKKEFSKALESYSKANTFFIGLNDSTEYVLTMVSIAEQYIYLKKYDFALNIIDSAEVMSLSIRDPHLQLKSFSVKSSLLELLGRFEESLEYLDVGYNLAIKTKSYTYQYKILDAQIDLLMKMNRKDDSLYYKMQMAKAVEDSIHKKYNATKLAENQAIFTNETNDDTIRYLTLKKNQKEETMRYLYFLIALLTITASSWVLWRIYILKQNRVLLDQKNDILKKGIEINEVRLQSSLMDLVQKEHDSKEYAHLLALKNEQIKKLKEMLSKVETVNQENDSTLHDLLKEIHLLELQQDADWEAFVEKFENAFPSVLDKIKESFTDLQFSDIRLFMILKLKLDNQDIASILNIKPDSVRVTKHRLKKRLRLDASQDIDEFIANFPESIRDVTLRCEYS